MTEVVKKYMSMITIHHLVMICGILCIVLVSVKINPLFGLILAFIPVVLYILVIFFNNPFFTFIIVNIISYFIMGIGRYIPSLQGGIIMDGMLSITFISLLLYTILNHKDMKWERTKNLLNLSILIWVGYCTILIFNPYSIFAAWMTGVRGEAFYLLLVVLLTQLVCTKVKHMKIYIFIWSVLILLALAKVLMQKYIGFDYAEMHWLYVQGFARTHVLQTTIRYFSFFTDAANFGAGMGYSMVFFSIIGFNEKKVFLKFYYLTVALLAGYGMMISGTRTALVVPFVGYIMYILLNKDFKRFMIMTFLLFAVFVFFKYTMILNRYGEIRRMRSAFKPNKDASYMVRLENQKKMKVYMADKYFGVGIGLGGGKAKRYTPGSYMSQIATDSWFVMIWVETGIIGLLLHIITLGMIMAGGAYILLFKIRDDDLRNCLIAFYGGVAGMIAASYSNEIFGQFPNGFTIFTAMAFIYLGPYYDKELLKSKTIEVSHE